MHKSNVEPPPYSSRSHKNNHASQNNDSRRWLPSTPSVHLRTILSLLLVWALVCQTATPSVNRMQGIAKGSASRTDAFVGVDAGWLRGLARALLPSAFAPSTTSTVAAPTDTLTDAVISRTAPTLNSGRIEGTLRVLNAGPFAVGAQITGDVILPGTPSIQLNGDAQHAGVVDDGGASSPNYVVSLAGIQLPGKIHTHAKAVTLPSDFPTSVPAPAGLRTLTVRSQSDVAAIGDWLTVRDLSVTRAGLSIDVPPGNYGTFTVNGNSRLNGHISCQTASLEMLRQTPKAAILCQGWNYL